MHLRLHWAAAALLVAASAASARDQAFDPPALARYDASYAVCETRFAPMAGHRDDAYLSLWRVAPGAKATARLAEVRASAAYQAERKRVGAAGRPGAPASAAFERQCRGLWGEHERRLARDAAARPTAASGPGK